MSEDFYLALPLYLALLTFLVILFWRTSDMSNESKRAEKRYEFCEKLFFFILTCLLGQFAYWFNLYITTPEYMESSLIGVTLILLVANLVIGIGLGKLIYNYLRRDKNEK